MTCKLDLRYHGKLSSDVSLEFNKLANGCRESFNALVSEISKEHLNNLDWWVQGPASRNTLSSSLFHNYCVLYLLRYLIDNKLFTYDEIIVDSNAQHFIIKRILHDSKIFNCRVQFGVGFIDIFKNTAKKYLIIYKLLFRKFYQLLVARVTKHFFKKSDLSGVLVLIDTFVMPGYIVDDRWYGSLWDNLSVLQKSSTYFIPTIVCTPLKSMFLVYKHIRTSSRNYILKEDFLNVPDLLFAINHKRRLKNINVKKIYVLGYEFSSVVREELMNNPDTLTVLESILTYRFICRIQLAGVKVRLAVDWFEGQSIDKAWSMGFNHFYPSIKSMGYRASESFPFYLCSYPIQIEKDAGVIPDVILVQGRGTAISVKEFMPDINTVLIPSFKSHHVWDEVESRFNADHYVVLVTLPISNRSASKIISRLSTVYEQIVNKGGGLNIIIKPHPTHSCIEVGRMVNSISIKRMSVTKERLLPVLLKKSNLLITEASSTCLEAIACGLSVILLQNEEGLTYDPIPTRISEKLYTKVRTETQLVNAVNYNLKLTSIELNKIKGECRKVREDYFEPITQAGIDRFMNLDTHERINNA